MIDFTIFMLLLDCIPRLLYLVSMPSTFIPYQAYQAIPDPMLFAPHVEGLLYPKLSTYLALVFLSSDL